MKESGEGGDAECIFFSIILPAIFLLVIYFGYFLWLFYAVYAIVLPE